MAKSKETNWTGTLGEKGLRKALSWVGKKAKGGKSAKDPYEEYNQKKYGDKVDTRPDSYVSSGQMGNVSSGGGSSRPEMSSEPEKPAAPAVPAAKAQALVRKEQKKSQIRQALDLQNQEAGSSFEARRDARMKVGAQTGAVAADIIASPRKRINQEVVNSMSNSMSKDKAYVDVDQEDETKGAFSKNKRMKNKGWSM